MFRIGEFSKLCGLSADTLYHYEKLNILVPVTVDKFTGYRFYDASQLVSVNKVLALKDAGFSLEEISNILSGNYPISALIDLLEGQAEKLETALTNEISRLERLHTNIFLIKNGGIGQMNEITIKSIEPISIASTRSTFDKKDFDENLDRMWSTVNRLIDEKNVKRTIPCLMLYHSGWWDQASLSMKHDAHTLDVEVAEPVTKNFDGSPAVQVYELPAVANMACIVHNGPFTTIGKAFDLLFQWIRENNYQAMGPLREIYHKGEWATSNPDEYVTELQVPIQI